MGRKKSTEKPRATSLLNCVGFKEGLMFWYGKHGTAECTRIKNESTKFGTAVHSLVETWLRKQPYVWHDPYTREEQCARLIIDWCEKAQLKVSEDHIEMALESAELGFTGHPDIINVTFGNSPIPWVLDWKTSNGVDDNYALQMALYALAYKEMTGIEINDAAVIRVEKDPNKTPQFEVVEYHNLFRDYVPLARNVKELWDYYKRKGKWEK